MSLSNAGFFTKIIYTLFGIVYLTSGLMINFGQLSLYLFVRPLSKGLFNKINYYLSYSLYSQIVFLLQYWANVRVTLQAKKGDFEKYFGKEQAFLIMNHSHEIDWMIGWILCDGCSILGNVKTFAKKSLQFLPTLGYSWTLGGSIFLERNWKLDQEICEIKLKELICDRNPFWLLLAAEGTRFTPEKHEVSKAFARERGLPELRYHLTPRTKGFTASVPIIRDKMAAIYSVNGGIRPEGVKPTLTNILLGKSINADFFVERIPMKDLPYSEADLAAWLHTLYKRKDDQMHNYLTAGTWLVPPDDEEFVSFLLPRKLCPAVNFFCWFIFVIIPFAMHIIGLAVSGNFSSLALVLAVIVSYVYVLEKLVGETQISKASSYGIATSE